ncbi:hypothetical protein N425_11335 [Tannerella sp. oral taxon BU063 isolate Cell 2]|uniref:Uncharacterized protein n=1 Tax=Tannerella sp. oral taxon BU063 isolate Cell 2 TaxID=1411148 RepID=W2C1X8_9BACT|nr:hypothetical protein N425_11335 [Tannerella sp. oral taxon BU063 isolate Cell 2]
MGICGAEIVQTLVLTRDEAQKRFKPLVLIRDEAQKRFKLQF